MSRQAQICGLHIIVHAVSYVSPECENGSNALFLGRVASAGTTVREKGSFRRNHQPIGGRVEPGACSHGHIHGVVDFA